MDRGEQSQILDAGTPGVGVVGHHDVATLELVPEVVEDAGAGGVQGARPAEVVRCQEPTLSVEKPAGDLFHIDQGLRSEGAHQCGPHGAKNGIEEVALGFTHRITSTT